MTRIRQRTPTYLSPTSTRMGCRPRRTAVMKTRPWGPAWRMRTATARRPRTTADIPIPIHRRALRTVMTATGSRASRIMRTTTHWSVQVSRSSGQAAFTAARWTVQAHRTAGELIEDDRFEAARRDAEEPQCGGLHPCGLDLDGNAHCWGSLPADPTHPEGDPFRSVPAAVPTPVGCDPTRPSSAGVKNFDGRLDAPEVGEFEDITAGSHHTCAPQWLVRHSAGARPPLRYNPGPGGRVVGQYRCRARS